MPSTSWSKLSNFVLSRSAYLIMSIYFRDSFMVNTGPATVSFLKKFQRMMVKYIISIRLDETMKHARLSVLLSLIVSSVLLAPAARVVTAILQKTSSVQCQE